MSLFEAKLNTNCVVKEIETEDEKLKLRLMELGIVNGTKIFVKQKSVLKKTLLVVFNHSCFTVNAQTAKQIVVKYA